MERKTNGAGIANLAVSLHVFAIVLLLAYFGKLLFIPLFFSFLIAVFLYPLCRWFEQHKINRLLSSILCIFISLLFCSIIVYFVGSQFQHFLKDIPSLKDKLDVLIQNIQAWLKVHFDVGDDTQSNYIDKSVNGLISAIGFTVSSVASLIIFFTLSLFFIFYMLFYRNIFKNFILSFLANQTKKRYWKFLPKYN